MRVTPGSREAGSRPMRTRTVVLAIVAVVLLAMLLALDVIPPTSQVSLPSSTSISEGPPTGTAGATAGG